MGPLVPGSLLGGRAWALWGRPTPWFWDEAARGGFSHGGPAPVILAAQVFALAVLVPISYFHPRCHSLVLALPYSVCAQD